MIQGRCPVCSKSYAIDALAELESFPFCSERCRLIDLGRWAGGRYAIPAGPARQPSETGETESLPGDDED
ncbi:MAG: DNA gyrase inhibitor YacG [Isosphaeraceae bacterium]